MGSDTHIFKNKQDHVSNPDVDWVHDNLNTDFDLNMNKNPSIPVINKNEEDTVGSASQQPNS